MLAVTGYYPGVDDFGKRVRAVREARDMQQMEVARAVAKSERKAKSLSNYLSRIERGDEDNPSLDKLEQIAAGLGLTLSAFFLQLEQSQNSSLIGRAEPSKDHGAPPVERADVTDDARAVPPSVVIDATGLNFLGRVIGRAIRDAARDRQAAASRKRQS